MKNLQKGINRFVIQKFISYGLHIGSLQSLWNPESKPFLSGFRNNFCILNPNLTLLYLRRAIKILLKAHLSSKTILFVGAPTGLEKEFSLLCSRYQHSFMEKAPYGFFTNYKNKIYPGFSKSIHIPQRPHLIFLFNPSLDAMVFAELKALDIPVIGFISSDDDYSLIDYPIPANIQSQKGGLFVYNLLYHLFSIKELRYVKKKVGNKRKLIETLNTSSDGLNIVKKASSRSFK